MLRVGFLGAGTVAELHAKAIAATHGVELAALYDPETVRAESLAGRYGADVASCAAGLIGRPDIDAVFVLTPTAAHIPLAEQCVDAGKHALVEKPVADDPGPIRALARRAGAAGRHVVPGHNYVHLPECARIVRQARSGELGRVRALFVTYAIAHSPALQRRYAGVLREVMVHHSYLALAILDRPDRVSGGASPAGRDDQAWMSWEYGDGALAMLFASFAVDDLSADPITFTIKALGTAGSASASWRTSATEGGPFRFGMPLYEETYLHQCAAFRDVVLGHGASASTLDDAATVAEIIHEVAARPSGADRVQTPNAPCPRGR